MSFANNQGERFYELLDALKNEYELHTSSTSKETHPKMSREDYEIKRKNFSLGFFRINLSTFSPTAHV